MRIKAAPDLLTVTDCTRALEDLAQQRPDTVAGKVLRWQAIADAYERRAQLWDEVGNASFERPGVAPELVAAAWLCAERDREQVVACRDAVTRWSKRGRR